MRFLAALFICCLSVKTTVAQNWQTLFDGKTLNGWTVVDPPVNVNVVNGEMKLHMTPHTLRHAYIRTKAAYKDFILELDFRRDVMMDSGILFRAVDAPDSAFTALFGYQVKIDPKPNRRWTGGIMTDFGNGYQWLQTLENLPKSQQAEKPGGEWNTLRIEAIDQRIAVFLNGIQTTNLIDDKYTAGFIAFKFHFLAKNEADAGKEIAFKNIRITTENINNFVTPTTLPLTDTRGILNIKYFR